MGWLPHRRQAVAVCERLVVDALRPLAGHADARCFDDAVGREGNVGFSHAVDGIDAQ